jgi:hypothetical protein
MTHRGQSTIAGTAITGPGSTVPALNWTGGRLNAQRITPMVSGGAIPGVLTPAAIIGNCLS